MGSNQSSSSTTHASNAFDNLINSPIKTPKSPFRARTPKVGGATATATPLNGSPSRNTPLRSRKALFQNKPSDPPMTPAAARPFEAKPIAGEEWRWLPVEQNPSCQPSDFEVSNECLGEGSFGKVMLGNYKPTGAKVAVKIVNKAAIPDNLKHYVVAEPKALRQLHHHNIIKLYLAHEDRQYIYLYLQYLDGGDLHTYVEEHTRLSERKAFKLFYQIAHSVAYCHRQSVCHRDLKLENIMLVKSQQRAVLIDFGFAGFIPSADHRFTDHPGSVCYAAPELIMGKEYDGPVADVYSLGVLLYVMVCGRYPFYSEDRRIMYHNITKVSPSFDSELSEQLVDLLSKMLAKQPEERIRIDSVLAHPWFKTFSQEESNAAMLSPIFSPLKTGTNKLIDTVERASPVKPRRLF